MERIKITTLPTETERRDLSPLRDFIIAFGGLLYRTNDEATILADGGALLKTFVSRDDWLPDAFGQPHPTY